jgi:vacuolar protein sorting-associated protein 26
MSSPEVKVTLDVPKKNSQYRRPAMASNVGIYLHGDVIKGKIAVTVGQGVEIEHSGVSVSILGTYQTPRSSDHEHFFNKTLQLLPAGKLYTSLNTPFNFDRIGLPGTSYYGDSLHIVYSVECRISRSGASDIIVRKPFFALRPQTIEASPFIKSIGISQILHVDIIFQSITIDPGTAFIGILHFSIFKIRMVSVSFDLVRREKMYEQVETVLRNFEVLDGAPARGSIIPIRFFVGGAPVWPAPKDSKIAVEYFLRVRAMDERDTVYWKYIPVNFVFQKCL